MGKHSLVESGIVLRDVGDNTVSPAETAPTEIPGEIAVSQPTQVGNKWRTTIRTVFQTLIGLSVLIPILVSSLGLPAVGWVAVSLGVAGAVAKVMADPTVNAWIDEHAPWLRTGG